LLCDGSAVSRSTYSDLFDAIGTTYGAGNGSTTFNVPDLRGRVPVGVDGTAGRLSANDALGNSGGAEKKTLGVTEIPFSAYTVSGIGTPAGTDAGGTPVTGSPFSIMQPYQVVNWLVKT
jgi:microcystin-dependent protein